ncbi:MAG: transglycosylase domain-containing protein [Moraxella sp.]|nr:transglycosylase domain-containing protein [Moraxella sp.]
MSQKNTTARLIFVLFRIFTSIVALVLVLALSLPIGFYGMAMYLEPTLPKIDELKTMPLEMPLQIYTADNKLIGQYGNRYSLPITYEELPKPLIYAFLAAEDDSFFEHSGISVKGLGRAITQIVSDSDSQTGGSTITQQVAKNYFLSPEQTFERKLTEMYLARKIENSMTKDEIMTLYVNKIYLGQGAYGIKAGARRYFSKTLDALTLAEMATLAGLPKAPSDFNPVVNPTRAKERRDWIIHRMLSEGFITKAEHDEAIASDLTLNVYQEKLDISLPYISEMARDSLVKKYGEPVMYSGWRVQLTIDSKNQLQAEKALKNGLDSYNIRHGSRGIGVESENGILKNFLPFDNALPAKVTKINKNSVEVLLASGDTITVPWAGANWTRYHRTPSQGVKEGNIIRVYQDGANWRMANIPKVQGALVSINPDDGALIAVVGGYDFNQSRFNRATQGYRQPGSTIKPLVYAAALESKKFTPESMISDGPLRVGSWNPRNADGRYYGDISMRQAIAVSRNLPVIRALNATGIEETRTLMDNMGLEKERLPNGLALALGAADATPLQMATAYSAFMNGGHRIQPYLIERIYSFGGDMVYQANPMQSCAACFNEGLEKLNNRLAKNFDSTHKKADDEQPTASETADNASADGASTDEVNADGATAEAKSLAPNATPQHDRLQPLTAPVYSTAVQAPRIIAATTAYDMADMLRGVIRGGTAKKALVLGRSDIGGKTGTTNQAKDAWFAGVHPSNVSIVWVGFDQPKTLGAKEYGGVAALPIWIEFMRGQLKDEPARWIKGGDTAKSETQKQTIVDITDDTPKEQLPTGTEQDTPAQDTQATAEAQIDTTDIPEGDGESISTDSEEIPEGDGGN